METSKCSSMLFVWFWIHFSRTKYKICLAWVYLGSIKKRYTRTKQTKLNIVRKKLFSFATLNCASRISFIAKIKITNQATIYLSLKIASALMLLCKINVVCSICWYARCGGWNSIEEKSIQWTLSMATFHHVTNATIKIFSIMKTMIGVEAKWKCRIEIGNWMCFLFLLFGIRYTCEYI